MVCAVQGGCVGGALELAADLGVLQRLPRLVPPGVARRIAQKSPPAVAASQLALNHARDHGTADALQQMALLQSAVLDLDEMRAAIAGWKAKSIPGFEPLARPEKP